MKHANQLWLSESSRRSPSLPGPPFWIRATASILSITLLPLNYAQVVPAPPAPTPAIPAPNPPSATEIPVEVKQLGAIPNVLPANERWSLPANPTDFEVHAHAGLPEPLVPTVASPTNPNPENALLALALRRFYARQKPDDFSGLERFVQDNPESRWNAALLTNLGILFYQSGYFSRSLAASRQAWEMTEESGDSGVRGLADRALSELAVMLGRIGEKDQLDSLLASTEDRAVGISSKARLDLARQGQWHMHNKPETAFMCGPYALANVRRSQTGGTLSADFLEGVVSTSKGFSLAEIKELAIAKGMQVQIAKRQPGSAILVPAVVHWKAGHFGALTKQEGTRYFMQDPTFRDNTWMTADAINDEASGYFLVPATALPIGWQAVSTEESAGVYGRGYTGSSDEDGTSGCDKKTGGGCESGDCGMPTYAFHAMLCSLSVSDSPIPPLQTAGPGLNLIVTYNQREGDQPAAYNFTNFSANWVSTFVSFIEERSPGVRGSALELRLLNGGGEEFASYNTATKEYERERDSRAIVQRVENVAGGLLQYERQLPGSTTYVYGHLAGSRIFLSEVKDTASNTLRYRYDSDEGIPSALPGRLRRIYTAENRYAEFFYEGPSPYLVTRIQDPWGRKANFGYDANRRLQSITDAVGMQSTFGYATDGFMESMTTPYGTTTFTTAKPKIAHGLIAWIQATDPLGGTERCEMNLSSSETGLRPEHPGPIPSVSGSSFDATANDNRNSFYWDREAWHQAKDLTRGAKYGKAHLYHWLQPGDVDESTGTLQAEERPVEGRIWYWYPGQTLGRAVGTHGTPSVIARVLDDGTTQASRREYNVHGKVTKRVDPIGRESFYEYFVNGTNLQFRKQKSPAGNVVLEEHENYHLNGEPGWSKDAAGQQTAFTYTSEGQIETVMNAKNEITRYVYGAVSASPNFRSLIKIEHQASAAAPVAVLQTIDRAILMVNGRVITRETKTDVDGFAVVQDYDELMRPIRTTYPDATYEEQLYDKMDVGWSRDRLGRWTESHFNARRQLIARRDPQGNWTQLQYCDCGDAKLLIDGNGNRTTWKYDVQGRVTDKLYNDGKGLHFDYEQRTSRLKRVTDALNQRKEYSYHRDDTLAGVTYLGAINPTPNVSYTYDPHFNRVATMVDGTGTTNYAYWPIAVGQFGAGRLRSVDGPLANDLIEYRYDELGRVRERPINGVNRTVVFDGLGRTDAVTNSLGSFDYVYVGNGNRLDYINYPNGQKADFAYFGATKDFRLQSITNLPSGGGRISRYGYDYNPAGQITEWAQERESGTSGRRYGLTYDWSDQLTGADRTELSGGTVTRLSYAYDPANNRISKQDGSSVVGAQMNGLNQITDLDGGGEMRVHGTVNEAAAVKVNGKPARMLSDTEFDSMVPVIEGQNTFTIEAVDASNNATSAEFTWLFIGAMMPP